LVEAFRKEKNFVKLKKLVNHVQQDVYFPRIAWAANQDPQNINGHAGVPLLVVICGGNFGMVIRNVHFFLYVHHSYHVNEEVVVTGGR